MSYSNSNNNNNSSYRGGHQHQRGVAGQAKNPHVPEGQEIPPSRTLFVRNVQFDTKESEVTEKLEPFGDIKDSFNLIAKRGLIFVTFFDLRSSENAMAALQGLSFNGRKCDIHYSIPKEGDRPEKSQASILVDCNEQILTHSLFEFMAKFGEIKSIRDHIPDPTKKIVSYWDSRACVRALEGVSENPAYGQNGKLNAVYFWDEGQEKFADKVNASSSYHGGAGGMSRDRRPERPDYRSGGRNYTRDRSLSPSGGRSRNNDSYSSGRDRDRDRNNRDFDRRGDRNDRGGRNNNFDDRRKDRDSDRNGGGYSYQSQNNAGQQQQVPTVNLMDFLAQGKAASVMPPQQGMMNPSYGAYNPAIGFPGQMPAQAPANNLLATLLQGQAAGGIQANQVQQLMSLLTQMAPQQQQQPLQGYNALPNQGGFPPPQQQQQQQPGMSQIPSALANLPGMSGDPRIQQQQQQQQQQQFGGGYSQQSNQQYPPSQNNYSAPLQQPQSQIQMAYASLAPQDPRLNGNPSSGSGVGSKVADNSPLIGQQAPSFNSQSSSSTGQSAQSTNLQNLAALLMQTQKK